MKTRRIYVEWASAHARWWAKAHPTVLLALLLGGCAVTRVEPPPPVAAPAQFKETALWQRVTPTTAVRDEWWRLFNDPVLDELQAKLVIGNENLKVAVAQVASARAQLEASRSALWPTLSAGASASRASNASTDTSFSTGPRNTVSLSA